MNRWSVAVAVGVVAALLFYLLQPILLPFVLGALVAYLGDPLVDVLARRGISRTLGVAIVFFVFSALVTIACVLALPLLLHQLDLLLAKIPVMYSWLTQETLPWIQRKFDLPLERLPQLNWSGQLADHWQSLGKLTAQTLVKISGSGASLLLAVANLALCQLWLFTLCGTGIGLWPRPFPCCHWHGRARYSIWLGKQTRL